MVGHPCGIRHHKTVCPATSHSWPNPRLLWFDLSEASSTANLAGSLEFAWLKFFLLLCAAVFANTCLLLYWYNRYAQVTKAYPGLPHLHAADFASTKADGQIDHLRLRWKWWCGVGAFSIIKIRAGGIAPIIEQKQKGDGCQRESMPNQISRLRWQLFPSSVQSCSHDLGFTNSCLEYF